MFQKHKAKVAEQKAEKQYQSDLAKWEVQDKLFTSYIEVAKTFKGNSSGEIMLKPGEALFYKVTGASLVGEKRGAGHYEGRSQGVSVPIGHIGHSTVRYRAGASKGHFVQGTPYEAAVDVGTAFITNRRVIFEGAKQTRECSFDKLIGTNFDTQKGQATFSTSNRQKPTTIHYGLDVSAFFVFRFQLAMAYYKHTLPQLMDYLVKHKAELEANKPIPPAQTT
ncbi:MAG TPA: hypothetical protein VMQ52_01260 [Candidatus Saccharimonadales bacterium]|jgi:hypothetical protein|nr:hypothetical protein [Candidatus Saccharimonadales bacterium]